MPQLPAPIDIVYYTPDEFYIVVPRVEWAKIGGYLYDLTSWIKAAGPCLKRGK